MESNVNNGRTFAVAIGAYQVIKTIINAVIGGFVLSDMLIAAAMLIVLAAGVKYSNYICAGILALVAIMHLGDNIANIGSNLIYLIEGILDIGAAVILCINKDVKEFFSGNKTEV
ncbi:MAG: hypothetical protein ACI4JM_12070 [Oscillospiraceae bacterium]